MRLRLVLMLALLTSPAVAGGFRDTVTCTVQGYVYVMPDEAPTFSRADNCPGIRWTIEHNALVLQSPHVIVTIVLPARTNGPHHSGIGGGPIAYSPVLSG